MNALLSNKTLRRVILIVALLNLAYFGVEFFIARSIGSVSLFADSIDFLEDASVNILILLATRWSALYRARLGMALAVLLFAPGLATLWTALSKFSNLLPPDFTQLSLTGLGALTINLSCALLLARYRSHQGSLIKAAFFSARNDAFANIGIIIAGGLTACTFSAWPDLIVGLLITWMNMDAAREVWITAHAEHIEAKA